MEKLDLSAYRRGRSWRVEETGKSLFFIDASLPNPNTGDMRHFLEMVDQYHELVRTVLDIEPDPTKDSEMQAKVMVWLYSSEPLETADLVGKPKMFYGAVNSAGVHLVTRGLAWDDPEVLQSVLHELVHHWWSVRVGEAPSLLNEGIAVYFERILSTDVAEAVHEDLAQSWQGYAERAEPGFLRRLCNNDTFWRENEAGEPVYRIGGQVVSFLLGSHGLPILQRIFLESHFNDPDLPDHIEDAIGESIESLEQQISAMARNNQ